MSEVIKEAVIGERRFFLVHLGDCFPQVVEVDRDGHFVFQPVKRMVKSL